MSAFVGVAGNVSKLKPVIVESVNDVRREQDIKGGLAHDRN